MFNQTHPLRLWHLLMMWVLGFASGLPLALTGATLQAWLTTEGIDIATIGFLTLVGLPYTFKFLWAPLMDRFELPLAVICLGRRRGWIVLSQIGIAITLYALSQLNPSLQLTQVALWAVLLSFLSASQDVVIDAYRTDMLKVHERGVGASLSVFGYRVAMIISGGIALIWVDAQTGNGWSWAFVYQVMGGIMMVMALLSLVLLPRLPACALQPNTHAANDLRGFIAVALTVAGGYGLTWYLNHILPSLLSLLIGIAITLPLVVWIARKAQFETLNRSIHSYFLLPSAALFLCFIVLYKLGDAFAGALATPFLLKGIGFTTAEIGVVNKVIGIWLTIVGAMAGGFLMVRIGLFRALLLFGILQMLSNLGFWLLAVMGKGAGWHLVLPAFNIWIVSLAEPTSIDIYLLLAIAVENLASGMGTAAFVAFLMMLCHRQFTATHYALLSAFAVIGRVWVGPFSGVLAEKIGWSSFFIFSTIMALPGLMLLYYLKPQIVRLEANSENSAHE